MNFSQCFLLRGEDNQPGMWLSEAAAHRSGLISRGTLWRGCVRDGAVLGLRRDGPARGERSDGLQPTEPELDVRCQPERFSLQ